MQGQHSASVLHAQQSTPVVVLSATSSQAANLLRQPVAQQLTWLRTAALAHKLPFSTWMLAELQCFVHITATGPQQQLLSSLSRPCWAMLITICHLRASTFFSSGGSRDANSLGDCSVTSAIPKCSCMRVATRCAALLQQHQPLKAAFQPELLPADAGMLKSGTLTHP